MTNLTPEYIVMRVQLDPTEVGADYIHQNTQRFLDDLCTNVDAATDSWIGDQQSLSFAIENLRAIQTTLATLCAQSENLYTPLFRVMINGIAAFLLIVT
jgi:hypothetical protein